MLFQLRGPGHSQGDPTPSFFPNSKGFLLGPSDEVSFVPGIFWEIGQKESKCFPENKGYGITCPPVYTFFLGNLQLNFHGRAQFDFNPFLFAEYA